MRLTKPNGINDISHPPRDIRSCVHQMASGAPQGLIGLGFSISGSALVSIYPLPEIGIPIMIIGGILMVRGAIRWYKERKKSERPIVPDPSALIYLGIIGAALCLALTAGGYLWERSLTASAAARGSEKAASSPPELPRREKTVLRPSEMAALVELLSGTNDLRGLNLSPVTLFTPLPPELADHDWHVVITAPDENKEWVKDISAILLLGLPRLRRLNEPDVEHNIDVPRFPPPVSVRGLILHGINPLNYRIEAALQNSFIVRRADTVDWLERYYQVQNISWIEIGKGSPLK
jgi:hypothetical protein